MRKLKLLMMALALIVGGSRAWAYQTPTADGVYYIQNVKTGKFVNYGWNFGARFFVDDYGTAWKLIADNTNFKIQAVASSDRNFQDDTWMYADGGGDRIRSYTISSVAGQDGAYTLKNTANSQNVYVYLKEDGEKYFIAGNAIKDDNYSDDEQTYWRFLSQEERDAYIAAQVHNTEAAVLANYGLTLPAETTLSAYLASSKDFKQTNVDVAAMSTWTWTTASPGEASSFVSTSESGYSEVYQGEGKVGGTLTKQMTGLTAGLYMVTLPAMYRFGTNETCYSNEKENGYKGLNGGSYFSAGGNAVPLATWASSCSSNVNPNGPSEFKTIVDNGGYKNVTFAHVTGTTLDLKVCVPGSIVKGWFVTGQATAIRYDLKNLSEAKADFVSGDEANADTWYAIEVGTDGYYKISSTVEASIYYSQDGSQLVTADFSHFDLATSGQKLLYLTAGQFYFKSSATSTISIAAESDVTSLINNAAVSLATGWTNVNTAVNQQYTGAPDDTYLDTYDSTLDQKQDVNLEAGYYLLKVATRASATLTTGNIYAWVEEGNETTKADIHREDNTGNLLDNGWAWTYVPFSVSTASRVIIGFYSECEGQKWAGADDFHLYYYTSELEMKKGHLAQVVADANAWAGKLTTTVSLEAQLSASAPSCTTVEECNTAITNLTNAISYGRATSDAYAAHQAMKANVAAIKAIATTEDAAAAKATLDAAWSESAVEAATDAATIETETAKIIPAVKDYIKNLTPSGDPFDLTFMIANPSFDNEYAGWSYTTDAPNPGNDATQKAAHAMEYFQKNFDIYQQLTDMPTGTYKLKVKAFQRPGGYTDIVPAYVNTADKADGTANVNAEIYVNGGVEESQLIKNAASPMITTKVGSGVEAGVAVSETTYYIPDDMVSSVAYFAAGHYENETEIVASSHTVKFGFRCASGTGAGYWTIFDDFRLYYAGPLDLSTFVAQFDAALAAAKEVSGRMNSTVATTLATAIKKHDGKSYETSDEYTKAIGELNAATDAAKASVAAYTKMKTQLDLVKDYFDAGSTNVYTATAYSTNYTDKLATWTDESISTDDADAYTFGTRVLGAVPSILLDPWKVGETAALTDGSLYINTWSTEGNNDGTNFKTPFFEYYTENTKDLGTKTFTATLPVENGNYQVSVWARVQQRTDAAKTDETSQRVRMTVNDGTPVSLAMGESVGNDFFLGTFKTQGIVEDGNLVIKIIVEDGSNCHWLSFQNLTYQKATDITIAEDAAKAPATSDYANVTLNRSFNAGWNAVCLPFATDAFDGAEIAEFVDETIVGNNVTLNFTKVDAFEANKPYLVYFPAAVAANKKFSGVAVAPAEVKKTGEAFDFMGTFIVKDVDAGNWVVSGGALKKASTTISLKPTRTYFAPKVAGARIAGFAIDDDETTGIAVIENEGKMEIVNSAYNLNGQKMNGQLKKGVYIINGKKTVVK